MSQAAPVKFMAQCLDCRGKPSAFSTYDERDDFSEEHRGLGHSVHLYLAAPQSGD